MSHIKMYYTYNDGGIENHYNEIKLLQEILGLDMKILQIKSHVSQYNIQPICSTRPLWSYYHPK